MSKILIKCGSCLSNGTHTHTHAHRNAPKYSYMRMRCDRNPIADETTTHIRKQRTRVRLGQAQSSKALSPIPGTSTRDDETRASHPFARNAHSAHPGHWVTVYPSEHRYEVCVTRGGGAHTGFGFGCLRSLYRFFALSLSFSVSGLDGRGQNYTDDDDVT